MFYKVLIEDIVRVPPEELNGEIKDIIEKILSASHIGYIIKNTGMIVSLSEIKEISEGMVIPEDGGVYYKVKFYAIMYNPEINELEYSIVSSITDFGAFASLGPLDGLLHISQIMDDEVVINGKDSLMGKNTKKILKVGDILKSRIVSISYRDITTLRVALTTKQPGLGKLEWLEEKVKEKDGKKKA